MSTPLPADLTPLDPREVPYDRMTRWIRIGFEVVGLGVLAAIMFADAWMTPTLRVALALGAALVVLLEVAFAVLWPPIAHRHVGYRVDALGLEIHAGVWWRSVVTVARSRIQHLDVTQGPLERRFGLATLSIHTAGTQDATVSLGGIAHETAMELRDDLGAWSREDDGV